MANVPSIPPLLSSTPPPIDFGEEDYDSGLPPTLALDDDDDFGDFALAAGSNEDGMNVDVSSLPRTPVQHELSSSTTTSGFTDMPPSLDDLGYAAASHLASPVHENSKSKAAKDVGKRSPVEAFNFEIGLERSAPYAIEITDATACDELTANLEDMDKQSADSPIYIEDINATHEESEHSLDDSSRIPSLKLSNLSLQTPAASPPPLTSPSVSMRSDESSDERFTYDGSGELPLTNPEGDSPKPTDTKEKHIADLSSPNHQTPASNAASDIVILEDIVDDSSDDECHSPKRTKNLIVEEGSADFFAIHAVQDPIEDVPNKSIATDKDENLKTIADEDSAFANFESTTMATVVTKSIVDSAPQPAEFAADFSQFCDSSSLNAPQTTNELAVPTQTVSEPTASANINMNNIADEDDDDEFDDFQDFQDFTEAASPTLPPNQAKSEPTSLPDSKEQETTDFSADNDDDDDDFGDFAEATITPAFSQHNSTATMATPPASNQPVGVNLSNLHERLKPLLEMMFPTISSDLDAQKADQPIAQLNTENSPGNMQLEPIDSAKALDYQWRNSGMRHALIASLGIDSRNILFGEKWNSSMPRFAANLSFNPLQPLKPQSAGEASAAASSTGTNSNAAAKTDVPAVEFDWNSSGLVNPLDGPKEQIADTRETETFHAAQLGRTHAPDDDEQQQSSATNASAPPNSEDDASADTAATTPTALAAAAAAAIPTNVPADSLSNLYADLGRPSLTQTIVSNSSTSAAAGVTNLEENGYNISSPALSRHALTGGDNGNHSFDDQSGDDEVVTTSTYAGPLKETHIYTPPKGEGAIAAKTMRAGSTTTTVTPSAKIAEPIDFDYEIAAAGIIIDETVVKKEYRDVEYNPGFSLELNIKSQKIELLEPAAPTIATAEEDDFDDEFCDFQSVPPPTSALTTRGSPLGNNSIMPATHILPAIAKVQDTTERSRTCSPSPSTSGTPDPMILSPAILLPHAISMENTGLKPKIEWGDSAANINPEELARIEELFPQPKAGAKAGTREAHSGQSPKSTPLRSSAQPSPSPLSISAAIAHKEQQQLNTNDDDYWSDFVSVPATGNSHSALSAATNSSVPHAHANNNNNNNHMYPSAVQRSPTRVNAAKSATASSNSNDDEWSDFISGAPAPAAPTIPNFRAALPMPQFNSGAWQNANFYNNPMSFYQLNRNASIQPSNNNNNARNNNYNNNQLNVRRRQQQQQQIHVMQDFSTAPPAPPCRPHPHATQFQVGSAKVAPSISLIPDLGFIAPAVPSHTAFINSLPKPSFSTKK